MRGLRVKATAQVIQIKSCTTGWRRSASMTCGAWTGPRWKMVGPPSPSSLSPGPSTSRTRHSHAQEHQLMQRGGAIVGRAASRVRTLRHRLQHSASSPSEAGGHLIRIYSTQNDGLDLLKELQLSGNTMDLALLPGPEVPSVSQLTAIESDRLHLTGSMRSHTERVGIHSAKVNCIAWRELLDWLAGSLDCSIIIWSVDMPDKHCIMRNAHDQSQISRLKLAGQLQCGPPARTLTPRLEYHLAQLGEPQTSR